MTNYTRQERQVRKSLESTMAWVQRNQYRGYEPADGNLSCLFALTGGRVFPMRVLQQIVLRAPFNIRPFLGVKAHESAIARGYMAWGYLLLFRGNGHGPLRDEAIGCLEWLERNRATRSVEFCWGDPYEYATRGGRRPYGEPLLIWSALIGQAFLEAYEILGEQKYLRIAESVGNWILNLPKEETESGSCLSYVAYRQASIHNASIMGGAFLARLGKLTKSEDMESVAKSAILYTCSRQRRDGSWYYAEEEKYHWIDNFHTGYNLWALKTYREWTGDVSFDGSLAHGLRFYLAHLFERDGRTKYFHDRTYPIDIQCAAQAIDTLASLADEHPDCLPLAVKVAEWTIVNMQDKDGNFYYRDLGWKKVRTPMLHWGQGAMVKALAALLIGLAAAKRSA